MIQHAKHTESPHDGQHDQGFDWQDGDIAFLRSVDDFSQADYETLIESGYLQERAAAHPVIILEHSRDYKHFLITTVSAYGSSEENNFLPPWKQPIHSRKSQRDFRAFRGSEKPLSRQEYLELADGQSFPKPKTSWVYTPGSYVVPSSALTRFDKPKERLRMDEMSLKSLLGDMKRHRYFMYRWKNHHVLRMLGRERSTTKEEPVPTEPPASTTSYLGNYMTASSFASNSKPATPGPSKPTMSWADVVRATLPVNQPPSSLPQPTQQIYRQNTTRFVALRPPKPRAVEA
ncbi:hypothetical protein F4776DRAFT_234938 [Hypoxylon sp. NC0597]|nr:hypothetical protein F4776DRAFT_234938 [Hypoxylon sp. NC0597]